VARSCYHHKLYKVVPLLSLRYELLGCTDFPRYPGCVGSDVAWVVQQVLPSVDQSTGFHLV